LKNILFVLGTRPEAIKLYPLIEGFRKDSSFRVIVVSTGQQKELLDTTLRSLGMVVDYSLQLMKKNQGLSSLTAELFNSLDECLHQIKPDFVFLHGDTTTSMVAGIVAKYNKLPVVHVEAGLRTYDLMSPWPEEMNRRINAVTSDYHLAPTLSALKNLVNEGFAEESIYVTGNTGIDTLRLSLPKISRANFFVKFSSTIGQQLDSFESMILVTLHRRENFDKLDSIFDAVKKIALKYNDHLFVYPVHLNPNVYSKAMNVLAGISNLILIEPVPYDLFVGLLYFSKFVITDSGGIQEEAAYLGKPVVLCRNTTERPEGVESNNIIMTGTNKDDIFKTCEDLILDSNYYQFFSKSSLVFGDGYASERIISWFQQKLF
jgi:UDP-N-acetylglucosamine 2-epimerase (non-hydrolysing)